MNTVTEPDPDPTPDIFADIDPGVPVVADAEHDVTDGGTC